MPNWKPVLRGLCDKILSSRSASGYYTELESDHVDIEGSVLTDTTVIASTNCLEPVIYTTD